MYGTGSRLRTNIIYGAIALLPIAAMIYVVAQMFGILNTLAGPLTPYLGENPLFKTLLLLVLTVLALLAICYLVGALINTQIGALSFERLESLMREHVPGYQIIVGLLRGIAGEELSYQPALITLSAPGTAMLGFVVEDEGDSYLTVFVPSAPVLTAGAIYVVERSRVQLIDGSHVEAANCVTQWGLGLKKFRGSVAPPIIC